MMIFQEQYVSPTFPFLSSTNWLFPDLSLIRSRSFIILQSPSPGWFLVYHSWKIMQKKKQKSNFTIGNMDTCTHVIFCSISLLDWSSTMGGVPDQAPAHTTVMAMNVVSLLPPGLSSSISQKNGTSNTPFTLYSRLLNQLYNRFDNRVERTATVRSTGSQTGLYNLYDNRLYTRYSRLSNRLSDNRLYRVNGA